MKMPHDVDATTIRPPHKRMVIAAAISVAVLTVPPPAHPVHDTGKARHDAMRVITGVK